jgi:hypothetical protein
MSDYDRMLAEWANHDDRPHPSTRCWTRPELDHGHCPSSTECTALEHFTPCDSCGKRPAGHGHFGLYCAPCSELPYGVSAP